MKSRRQLSREEHELWGHVTRGVKRIRPTPPKSGIEAAPKAVIAASPDGGKSTALPVKPAPPPKPAHKPLVALEPKTKRRLGRGQTDVAARIDLHGMRQDEAHGALLRFIADAHARDARIVLVITGKGKTASQGAHSGEREVGVLRRMVPHWLSEPSLRRIVLGYEPATARHGGDGAIYVRIRKGTGT